MKLISTIVVPVLLLIAAAAAKAPPSEAEIDAAKEYFDKRGFLLLQNFFSDENKQVLSQWKAASDGVFREIFQELYDRGHASFPQHVRTPKPRKEDYGNVIALQPEYAMKEGSQEGFQEIVMRNPGTSK